MTLGHILVDSALADLRLTRVELNVFRVMWVQMDFEQFREKKAEVLAIEVGTDRSYAAAALRRLVEYGYLELGERSAKGVGTYRLPRGWTPVVVSSTTSADAPRMRRQLRSSL